MLNFFQTAQSPALKHQMDSQFSFYSDVFKRMFDGVQKINELNIQVAQTVMDESLTRAKDLMQSPDLQDRLSISAGQVQPAAEKMRAYQQHVENILAETQVGIAKVAESHLPNVTHAVEAVAQEVVQRASEETAKVTQRQKDAVEKLTTPIKEATQRNMQNQAAKVGS